MDEARRQQALEMLDFTVDDPPTRALRAAAIFASLFEEDPTLHEACGVQALFAWLHANNLAVGSGFYDALFATWSLASYELVVPAFLTFRDGERVKGELGSAFERLAEARALRATDRRAAVELAQEATLELLRLDQEFGVQQAFVGMPDLIVRGIGGYVGLQVGPASEVEPLTFGEEDFQRLDRRIGWLEGTVVPAWRQLLRERGALVVSHLRHLQLKGWYQRSDLPPRAPEPAAW